MLDMPSGHIHSVAFSPDGRTLLVGDDNGEIALWSFGESEPEKRGQFVAHKDAVNVLVFSPDGKKLLSGAYDHQIGVWAWQEGQAKRLGTLTGHSDWIGSLAFSPDGRTLYSGGWDHIVRRWTAAGNSFVPADEFRGHSHPVDAIAFSPDGSRIACGALSSLAGRSEESPANEVRVWRLGGTVPEPEAVLSGCTGWIQKLAFSQSGKLLAASSDAGITRWRVPEWSVAKQLPADEKGDPTFRPEIGYAKFVLRGKLSGLKPMQAAAFAPDRRLLATGHCDHGIYLWQLDGEKLQSRQVLVGHQSSVGALDFSPRGQLLASGGWDGQLVIWNVAARTMKKSWQLPGRIWDVRFAPDGRHLAVGDGTGVVYVLRLKL
jgi:WD40 repeat protein